MKNIILFFDSLENREKLTLFIGIAFVIIFIGSYITVSNYKTIKKLEKKLITEISNYHELLKLAQIYSSNKKNLKNISNISILKVYEIAQRTNVKDKLISVRPITYKGKEGYELSIEKITPSELESFINALKKESLKIYFLTIDNIRQNNKLKVRMTVGK